MTNIRIASASLSAEIAPLGAELRRLDDGEGRALLWSGDPKWWGSTAPILFPIVGMLAGDRYRLDWREYALPKHGFARRREFEVVAAAAASATFRLRADDETRAHYPFDFTLDLRFAIEGAALTMTATLANDGAEPMPASFGFHPAFAWPLPYARPRADHRIRFAAYELAPIRRIDKAGLLTDARHPTPVEGRDLALRDELFEDDALIFLDLASRSLTYGSPGAPGLAISWQGLPELGLWTKPGADYLCIEPWQGHADPAGFAGDFREKPGVIEVAAGAVREFVMQVKITEQFCGRDVWPS